MVEASLAALIHPLQDTEYSNESELLAACRRREIRAFEQVYLAHGGRLKSIAYRILGNRSDAEDAVQETLPQALPRDRSVSRAIQHRDLVVPDSDQHLPRRGAQTQAGGRSAGGGKSSGAEEPPAAEGGVGRRARAHTPAASHGVPAVRGGRL